ncbi:hypothetical protein Tco_0355498, partial [Tanacetum coccineum]
IKIEDKWMKVHVAYDRRGYGKDTMGAVARGYVNRVIKSNGGGGLGREAKWDFNDKRRFVDVVNGKHKSEEWDNMYKNVDAKNQKNSEANETLQHLPLSPAIFSRFPGRHVDVLSLHIRCSTDESI